MGKADSLGPRLPLVQAFLLGYHRAMEPRDAFLAGCRALNMEREGRFVEAGLLYKQVVQRAPEYEMGHVRYGHWLLMMGRWAESWPRSEWRHQAYNMEAGLPELLRECPRLQSLEAARGRTVLVLGEMGVGDHLMAARFLPLLARSGARVVFVVRRSLKRLFASLEPEVMVRASGEAIPVPDLWLWEMSLPLVFSTTPDTVPPPLGVVPEPEPTARWAARLSGAKGLKVGLSWRGNPGHARDSERSIPLETLRPLLEVPGVSVFGLSVGEVARQEVAALAPGLDFTWLGHEVAEGPDEFVETAACLAGLDMLISVDTGICHLAGVLGVPVWTLVTFYPDGRWMLEREDTPWYPSMRLFRQPHPGDWPAVAARVAGKLAALP